MSMWDSGGRLIGLAKKDCKLCEGTGWKIITDPQGVGRAQTCDCKLDRIPAEKLNRACIPPRFAKASFENFRAVGEQAPLAIPLEFARRYVEDWTPPVELGLAFLGRPGAGKTHLAVATIRELILRKGVDCYFCDFRALLDRIRNTFDSKTGEQTEAGLLTPVIECELLLLDEIVDAWPSVWVKERLAYIINSRYNAKRATIITTTLGLGIDHRPRTSKGVGATDDASIQREFGASSQQIALRRTLAEFDNFGAQIASRFFEMCKPIEMPDVPDFRRTMKTAGNTSLFE